MTEPRTDRAAAAELRAMTPDQHLEVAIEVLGAPPHSGPYTAELLTALVHLGLAQVKQATRYLPGRSPT